MKRIASLALGLSLVGRLQAQPASPSAEASPDYGPETSASDVPQAAALLPNSPELPVGPSSVPVGTPPPAVELPGAVLPVHLPSSAPETSQHAAPPVAQALKDTVSAEHNPLAPSVASLQQSAGELRDETERQIDRRKRDIVDDILTRTRVESQSFRFGIYPNSAGFMDARLHGRMTYLSALSSGLYLDYTTARAGEDKGTASRMDRLIREYRGEADVVKGILVLLDRGDFAWSLEPGLNSKAIYQEIDESGFDTNAFDETIFNSGDLRVLQLTCAAKLETTLVFGRSVRLDLGGEYLPWVYQQQKGTTITNQFDEPVRYALRNTTQGYQFGGELAWDSGVAGQFAMRGLMYRTRGNVASRSAIVSGNFEYVFETYAEARRYDTWIELVHTATYVELFGRLVPAFALAFQRKRIDSAEDSLNADTYKAGLLLEWR